ncbi:hypothetical protein EV643_12661 [Kribbella sp. VKM Ac-2527]|uniref:Uncharacterized protein n=1 Tax=Kribbella caucasensis TaxID=2512215 RepID=A0A4R6JGA2_9ACTN|nr:hypothetical protein [Kribbella sp. VKM Ac-2527]TDO34702.1 hypothetical protein EV643_12661 [Kribbella sp. VKM Ac-2527]
MRNGVFAYTWDLVGDPDTAARFADLGADTVTLQASYHSVRATTAWHPRHRVVHAEHAAAYFRLRPESWGGLRLQPPAPSWGVEDEDRFGTATAALTAVGLRTEAWVVLTHSSALGGSAPDLTVRNAYGERFGYALCPAQPDVWEYALMLVREICEQYDVPALVLEACGWLGFEHGSHHEKTSGADLSTCAKDLLSICLCPACARGLSVDVDELAADIRTTIDRELQDGIPAGQNLVEALGRDRAQAVYDHRRQVITGLVAEAASIARGREVLLMATDDPQVTGPDVGVDLTAFEVQRPDGFVVKCWDDEEAAIARVKAAAARTDVPIVANVNALGERPAELPALAARLVAAGASGLRYYHGGLASPARQAAIRAAVEEVQ